MNFRIALALITPLMLFSCKKDSLEGDRSIFEGKWEWVYSIRTTLNSYNSITTTDTIYPADVSSTFGLEFLSKGKLRLIENEKMTEEYRTVFFDFRSGGNCMNGFLGAEVYEYIIFPNNDEEFYMDGCVSADTLTFSDQHFPFDHFYGSATSIFYENFFKKVN